MVTELILSLSDSRATLESVGGKGASLARLSAAGLPVPDGFHITTAAYRQVVMANELPARLLAALQEVDIARPATLEAASAKIQDLFARAQVPPEITAAIGAAYQALGGESENGAALVAVRSSATAEDLPGLSFAGQQETFLNVCGVEQVLDAVRRCWASLWTGRAIGYRLQHGIDQNEISLAVVVQCMVPADIAGILFTANPLNGRRHELVVNAAWGLGEAVVGGQVSPDTIVVEKGSGRILQMEVADKQVMTVPVPGGTQEQAVQAAQQHAPVLDEAGVADLADLARQVEALYGAPQDIEWCRAGGRFFLVQSRPITALPPETADVSLAWNLPDSQGAYGRGSIIELLPDPLTPLFRTLAGKIIDVRTRALFMQILGFKSWKKEFFLTINDYAYFNFSFTTREILAMLWGSVSASAWMLRPSVACQRWQTARATCLECAQSWQAASLPAVPAVELLEGVRRLTDATVVLYTMLQSGVIPAASSSEAMFTQFYQRLIRRPQDPPALDFLLGAESTPIRAEKALYDLAQWARSRPALAAYLLAVPAARLVTELQAGQAPDSVAGDDWSEMGRRLQSYLQHYGYSLYDLDFAKPTPVDDPAPLLETCKMYLQGQGVDPYARLQALADRRQQARQRIVERLDPLRRRWFVRLLEYAQECVPLREDGLADLGLAYPLLRRLLRELGERLIAAGALADWEDIFWLQEVELEEMVAALQAGRSPAARTETIAQRRSVWRAEKLVTPPAILPPGAKLMGINPDKFLPAQTNQSGDTLRGFGASTGRVTGTARVLQGPQDFDQMHPGDILVASITTPAWTPLFAQAAAIVTDVGGPLSHSSIVAREYGIPAVLGTGVASRRIHSGQVITVDGGAGTVKL